MSEPRLLTAVAPPPVLPVNQIVSIDDRIRGYTWCGIVTHVAADGTAYIYPVDDPLAPQPKRLIHDELGLRSAPTVAPGESITCPKCGTTSYHPGDIANRYCGRCHWWTSDPLLGPHAPEDDPDRGIATREAGGYGPVEVALVLVVAVVVLILCVIL